MTDADLALWQECARVLGLRVVRVAIDGSAILAYGDPERYQLLYPHMCLAILALAKRATDAEAEARESRAHIDILGTASQPCSHVEARPRCASCFNRRLEDAEAKLARYEATLGNAEWLNKQILRTVAHGAIHVQAGELVIATALAERIHSADSEKQEQEL
jgi:hypothetical protein